MFWEISRILCGALRNRVGRHVEVDCRARGRDHWIIWTPVPFEKQTSSVVGTVPGLPHGARDSICSATASCTADHRQIAWSMASMACLPAAMACKVRNRVSGRVRTRRQGGHDWSTVHAVRLFVTTRRCRVTLPPRGEDEGEDEDEGEGEGEGEERRGRVGGVLDCHKTRQY